MIKTKFTEGDWFVNEFLHNGSFEVFSSGSNKVIAQINTGQHDAHLIAAAPDMYEMLSAINKINVPQEYLNDDEFKCLCNIDKLLAKARGE